jgi:hypothetical protein
VTKHCIAGRKQCLWCWRLEGLFRLRNVTIRLNRLNACVPNGERLTVCEFGPPKRSSKEYGAARMMFRPFLASSFQASLAETDSALLFNNVNTERLPAAHGMMSGQYSLGKTLMTQVQGRNSAVSIFAMCGKFRRVVRCSQQLL